MGETRARIVLIEDDTDLRRMLARILRTMGDVLEAETGTAGYALITVGPPPDLIVTDVMMPEMDGLSLAKRLKGDPRLASVPVLMLTARTRPADVIAGIQSGARFYVTKPFKTEELMAKVRKALQSRKKNG